jgi:hypothetical protein
MLRFWSMGTFHLHGSSIDTTSFNSGYAMAETTTIDLTQRIESFRFVTAEWWDEKSKFVVVRGSTEKDSEDFAVRLDIEKRAFLDHVSNPMTDKLVQSQASQISQLVWNERAKREGRRQLGAA